MPTNHFANLLNARIALFGFSGDEATVINEALGQARASGRNVDGDSLLPGINSLVPYHACLVNAAAIIDDSTISGISIADLERRPVLLVTDVSDLSPNGTAFRYKEWDFLVRPIEPVELIGRLSRFLSHKASRLLPAPIKSSRRVLIVDDEDTVRTLLVAILETAGFQCDPVSNVTEAMAALTTRVHDLILLDLNMPGFSGFKFLEMLRNFRDQCNPAVIVVSSSTREDDILHGLNFGVDDYITKPFRPRELVARVQRTMRKREARPAEHGLALAHDPVMPKRCTTEA